MDSQKTTEALLYVIFYFVLLTAMLIVFTLKFCEVLHVLRF